MGQILKLPILEYTHWKELESEFAKCKEQEDAAPIITPLQMYLADGGADSEIYHKYSYAKNGCFVVVIGSEAFGISSEARDVATRLSGKYIKIPMVGDVESLNAAIAGSIILSEIQRQRMIDS